LRDVVLIVTGSGLIVEDLPVLADLQLGLAPHAEEVVAAVAGGGVEGTLERGGVRARESQVLFSVAIRGVFRVLAVVGEGGEGEASRAGLLEGFTVYADEEVAAVLTRTRIEVTVLAEAASASLSWLKFAPGATVRFDGVDARVATVGDGVLEDETVRALLLGGLAVLALGIAVAVLIVGVVVHVLWGALLTVCDGDAEGDE